MRIENKFCYQAQPTFSSRPDNNPYRPPAYTPPPKKNREKLKMFLLMLGASVAIFAPGEINGCVKHWNQRRSVNNAPVPPGATSQPKRVLPTPPFKSNDTIRIY